TEPHAAEEDLRTLVSRDHQDLRRPALLVQSPDDLEAIHAWHPEVQDEDVRLQSVASMERFGTGGRDADDLERRPRGAGVRDHIGHHRMIVRDQYREPVSFGTGSGRCWGSHLASVVSAIPTGRVPG